MLKFQEVLKKTAKNFRGLFFAAPYMHFNFNVAAHNDDDERRRQTSVTIYSKQKSLASTS